MLYLPVKFCITHFALKEQRAQCSFKDISTVLCLLWIFSLVSEFLKVLDPQLEGKDDVHEPNFLCVTVSCAFHCRRVHRFLSQDLIKIGSLCY